MAYPNIYTFYRVQYILRCIFTTQIGLLPPPNGDNPVQNRWDKPQKCALIINVPPSPPKINVGRNLHDCIILSRSFTYWKSQHWVGGEGGIEPFRVKNKNNSKFPLLFQVSHLLLHRIVPNFRGSCQLWWANIQLRMYWNLWKVYIFG